ncbi:MAG: NAD(P)H-dependent glycerol-3-phosphate dehydrogenase [Myxococcota bacterium]|nr:NAD(P)H-dependent glycerol-3-phosphate dehydrogenase [Myxococcota bacterium]MEC9390887.1 NAD(P)H-dependent glycerol-3-phosphate dehydrogenase [Myxococcota bacterium]
MRCAVLGSGSWGTALAIQLARSGDDVWVWARSEEAARRIEQTRENSRYLPGIPVPDGMVFSADLPAVLRGAAVVVVAVPSQHLRGVMQAAGPLIDADAVVCCASKGVENGTLLTMAEVMEEVLPATLHGRICALAGPSFAREVAEGRPTAVVVASHDAAAADVVAEAFHGGAFRAYHTDDVVGAELGGALKNVIAIATGVADGIGAGLNARAALITRGLAEIGRLAVHRGANPLTLAGLAGMGDLVLTCTGDLSRNRRVGLGLGAGRSLDDILAELGQVAEGVMTTRSARNLGRAAGVDMPITEEMYRMLFEDKPVPEVLRDLLGRERKAERD